MWKCLPVYRWPLLIFFNALDVAVFCAYPLFRKDGHKVSRKVFLKNLSKQLAHSSAVVRHTTNTRLPRATKEAALVFGFLPEVVLTEAQHRSVGRCKVCSKVSRSKCDTCQCSVCLLHRRIVKRCRCATCWHSGFLWTFRMLFRHSYISATASKTCFKRAKCNLILYITVHLVKNIYL